MNNERVDAKEMRDLRARHRNFLRLKEADKIKAAEGIVRNYKDYKDGKIPQFELPPGASNAEVILNPVRNSITWDAEKSKLFYEFCLEEIDAGNIKSGKLVDDIAKRICLKMSKAGINCDAEQLKRRWKAAQSLHHFWYFEVLFKPSVVKDEKWWKDSLKRHDETLEYRNLRYGPPPNIKLLDRMFGVPKIEKALQDEVTDARKKYGEAKDLDEQKVELLEKEIAFLKDKLKDVETISSQRKDEMTCLKKLLDAKDSQIYESEESRQKLTNDLSNVEIVARQQNDEINRLKKLVDDKDSQIREGENLRKKLSQAILDLKGNMRVFVRVRPLLKHPGDENTSDHIQYPEEFCGRGITMKFNGQVYPFLYDKVFGPQIKQLDIFEDVKDLVQSAVDGFKVCILAYGQTGSGKTYTMIGTSSADTTGIIPRSLEEMFERIRSLDEWMYDVHVLVAELYLNDLYDQLAPNHCKIKISDLTEEHVSNNVEAMALVRKGLQNRSVRSTKMNEESSRSHLMLRVKLSGLNKSTGQTLEGYLNFMDLAGSEKIDKSGCIGEARNEASAINSSLTHLLDVFYAISNKDAYIPFRRSKLTELLKPYLSGGAKSLMIVNVAPELSSINETISSLKFGSRVKDCYIGVPIQKEGHHEDQQKQFESPMPRPVATPWPVATPRPVARLGTCSKTLKPSIKARVTTYGRIVI